MEISKGKEESQRKEGSCQGDEREGHTFLSILLWFPNVLHKVSLPASPELSSHGCHTLWNLSAFRADRGHAWMERYLRDVSTFQNSELVCWWERQLARGVILWKKHWHTHQGQSWPSPNKASLVGSRAKTWKGRMGSPSWTCTGRK